MITVKRNAVGAVLKKGIIQGSTGIDLTTVSAVNLFIQLPGAAGGPGTRVTRAATILGGMQSTSIMVSYAFQSGDLDILGEMRIDYIIFWPGGPVGGLVLEDTDSLQVVDEFALQ